MAVEISPIVSPTGLYEAYLEPRDLVGARRLDVFCNYPADKLNTHLINDHFTRLPGFYSLGFRFDAELAAFAGISLEPTMQAGQDLLTAIDEGRFTATETCQTIANVFTPGMLGLEAITLDAVLPALNERYDYERRIRSELGRLADLGVAGAVDASAVLREPELPPATTDSFFITFNVIPVTDSVAR